MRLVLTLFAIALAGVLIGGLAVNVSPRGSVVDGLRVMLAWLLRGLMKFIVFNVDFWEAVKALFSGLIWSGAVAYGVVLARDASKFSPDLLLSVNGLGVVVGFVGVAASNAIIRRLSSGAPRP